ncbi:hypothetical protein [Mycolicibacterium moriokaense]|uniref:Uncharacterized protein n=1 Tax=Mycolicibacterium moriokaense TaxID=39691 RepID=A0A318H8R5_9MYCO|nr:hypothetical protein [Mycolicibacterium moriokaense]PXW98498.1 hypothetical protein C8E89_14413 [Mycolicibacterium moriokaense]
MSWTALGIVAALACVGLVICSLLPAGTPEGMCRVKCPRCGITQNVIALNLLWECRLCGQVSSTPHTLIERDQRIREQIRRGALDH